MEKELLKKAISEIENPTFGTTEYYLEVLNVEIENVIPKVERVDFESSDRTNIVYFSIKEEPFFFECLFLYRH